MGAQLETVTVQHQHAKQPKTIRLSRKVRHAVDLMVFEARNRADAAKEAGLQDNSMRIALQKPHVLAYLAEQQKVIRTSATARTIAKAEQIMDSAPSMRTQLAAIEFLNPPVQRTENTHFHEHSTPGLVLTFNMVQPASGDMQVIEGQSHEAGKPKQISGLPERVPHPSERNAVNQGVDPTPAKATRGGKT